MPETRSCVTSWMSITRARLSSQLLRSDTKDGRLDGLVHPTAIHDERENRYSLRRLLRRRYQLGRNLLQQFRLAALHCEDAHWLRDRMRFGVEAHLTDGLGIAAVDRLEDRVLDHRLLQRLAGERIPTLSQNAPHEVPDHEDLLVVVGSVILRVLVVLLLVRLDELEVPGIRVSGRSSPWRTQKCHTARRRSS